MSSQEFPLNVLGKQVSQTQGSFNQNDAIIYALGIGYSQDPLKEQDYRYTYEMNQNFSIFPTIGQTFLKTDFITLIYGIPNFPQFNPAMCLHVDQKFELIAPSIKPNTPYVGKFYVKDILDKGKMTLFVGKSDIYQKIGNQLKLAAIAQGTLAIFGLSANGYKGNGTKAPLPKVPDQKSDLQLQASSYLNQALVYRLTGDKNPIHVSKDLAALQKLSKPILHGMATKGIVARTIVQHLLQNDASRIKAIHVRFSGVVFPGQSFLINVWKQPNKFIFQAKCKQRNTVVLIGSMQTRQAAKL